MFPYSNTCYRPLWTYIFKDKSIDIICYFYSTFSNPQNATSSTVGYAYELGNISWPKIFVWDDIQVKNLSPYVRSDLFDIKIINVGPIWFTDTSFIFKEAKKRIILFDLTTHRKAVQYGFEYTFQYSEAIDNLNYLFLNDIFKVFKSSNYEIILKRKRPSFFIKTNYKKLVDKLVKKNGLIVIDEAVSTKYLIQNCDVSFSMPFTSASFYQQNKKNNFWYDPIKKIYKDDLESRGYPIISGINELQKIRNELDI